VLLTTAIDQLEDFATAPNTTSLSFGAAFKLTRLLMGICDDSVQLNLNGLSRLVELTVLHFFILLVSFVFGN
jgi:hypothetical protein